MATVIGQIIEVNGEFEIVNENGEIVQLQEGQELQVGDQIQGIVQEINGELQLVNEGGELIELSNGLVLETIDSLPNNTQQETSNTTALLNNGEQVTVSTQNPLVLDPTVTNNQANTFEETQIDNETLDNLESDLIDETNLVVENNNDNDTDTEEEDEVQSDDSKARELDRNGDIADVVADLREPVIDYREPEENVLGEEETRFNEAKLSINGVSSVIEGNKALYTLNVSEVPSSNVHVTISYSGVAIDGLDYTGIKNIVIPSGSKEVSFLIDTIDDYYAEGTEPYTLEIISALGGGYDQLKINPTENSVTTKILDSNSPDPDKENPSDEDIVYVKISNDDETTEADGSTLTHKVSLIDNNGNPVIVPSGSSIKIKLIYSNDTTENEDYITKVFEVDIPSGSSSTDIINIIANDDIYEIEEGYTLSIDKVIDINNTFEKMEIDSSNNSTTGKIDDEDKDGDTPPDDKEGDKPTLNLTATDALAIEGVANDVVIFQVAQTNESNSDTVANFKLTLNELEVADITSVKITDGDGTVTTLTTAAEIQALVDTGVSLTIDANSSQTPTVEITPVDDSIYEISEAFGSVITTSSDVNLGTDTAVAAIDDEDKDGDTPPDDKEGDKPTLNLTATDALAIEGVANDVVIFQVAQTNESNSDTVANFKLTLNELEVADITSVKITDGDGTVTTLTTAAEIQALVDTGVSLTIDANSSQTPTVEITPVDDSIYEISEAFGSVITTSSDVNLGTDTAVAAIDDEDKDGDTPPDDKEGDKPTLNLTATDALAIEGVANDVVIFQVAQTNESNSDTVANFKLTLNELEVADITSVKITDGDGTVTTLTTAAEIQALVDTGVSLTIDANSSQTPTVEITPVDDSIYEISEAFGSVITTSSDVNLGTDTAVAAIDDEDKDGDTPPDDKEGDKPTLNLTATDALAIEGVANDVVIFQVAQTNESNSDTVANFKLTLNELEVADITSVKITDGDGTVTTLTTAAEIQALVDTGVSLTIDANSSQTPTVEITPVDDSIYEISEAFGSVITTSSDVNLGTDTAVAAIDDEDKDGDTPPDDKEGDKPTLNLTATDALAIEGVANDVVIFQVAQTNESNSDTVANFKLTLNELEVADITSVKITDGDGTVTTLTTAAEIQALVDTGVSLTIDANSSQTPTVEITPVDDSIYEISEAFGSVITTSSDVNLGTDTAVAAIDDEDKDGDTPPDDKEGDKPTLNLTATDALAIEGVANDVVIFQVAQTNESNSDTVANFKLTLNELEVADITSVKITDGDGTVTTLTTAAEIQALVDTGVSLTIDANSSQTPTVEITPVDDSIYEISEAFGSVITTSSDVNLGTDTAVAAIDDEDKDGDTPPDDKEGDKPTLNLTATDALAIEGVANDVVIFQVAQTNESNSDTVANFKLTLNELEVADITSVKITDGDGTVTTLTTAAEIQALVDTGVSLTIDANSSQTPTVEITPVDDSIYEISEAFGSVITTSSDVNLGTDTAVAAIDDEDKDGDTPPDDKEGDKPTLNLTATDALAIEGVANDVVIFQVAQTNESNSDTVANFKLTLNELEVADITSVKITDGDGTVTTLTTAAEIQALVDTGVSLTIDANSSQTPTVEITPVDDSIYEISEAFGSVITTSSDVNLGTDTAVAAIDDEDKDGDTPPDDKEGDKPTLNLTATDALAIEGVANDVVIFQVAQTNESNSDTVANFKLTLNELEVADITSVKITDGDGTVTTLTTAAEIQALVDTGVSLTIDANSSQTPTVEITPVDDSIYEISEAFGSVITTSSDVNLGTDTAVAAIDDEDKDGDTPPDDKEGDKPTLNLTATDALAIEGVANDVVIFQVAQTNESNSDTVANFKLTLNELEVADITSVKITDGDGTVTTLTTAAEIQALVDTGVSLTIDANSSQTPTVEITPVDDSIYEISEAFGSVITTSSDVNLGTDTAVAAIDDEDKDGDTPPDDKEGDKPTLNLTATDALAIEGVANDVVIFQVAQTNESNSDTVANFKLTLNELEVADITSVKITDGDGTVTTLTTAAEIQALVDTGVSLTIDANSSQTPTVEITPVDDSIYEISEAFGSVITTSSDVNLGTDTAVAAIDDEDKDGDTPPDDKEGDKPTLNLTATDALAIEGVANDVVIFQVAQTNESNSDTVANFKLTLNELEVADITSVKITDGDGTVTTLTTAAEIQALVDTGVSLTIDANSSQTPTVEITPVDDSIYEISEAFGSVITTSSDVNLGTDTAVAAIDDEDKDGDTPPDDKEGDKPTLNLTATDALAIEGVANDVVIFQVAQTNESNSDTVANFKLTLNELEVADITSVKITDGDGTVTTLTTAAEIQALVDTGVSLTIDANSSQTPTVEITPVDDSIYEISEAFGSVITTSSDVNLGTDTAVAAIDDEDKDGDTPPDDKEGDKPTLNLTATDALAIEGVANDVVIFQVAQTNESNSDTVANFKLTLNELEVADITSVKITDGDGTVTTLTTAAEIQALVDTGVSLTIDANSSQTPTVEITPVDDSIYEISEAFGSVITTSSDVNLGTDTAVAAIDDEDKDGDTPPDDKEGDKPTLNLTATDALAIEGVANDVVIFQVAQTNESNSDTVANFKLTLNELEVADITSVKITDGDGTVTTLTTAAEIQALVDTGVSLTIDANSSQTPTVEITPVDDSIYEISEAFGSVITTSSDVNLGTDTAVAAIDDEDKDGDTPPDDKEGDKPTLNLTATDALAIEGVANDVVIFQVAQTNESNSDTVANFKLTLNELEVADITSVKITDGDGTVTTLTTAAEIQALVDTGVSLTIDANSSQTPTVEITPVDDSIYEISEAFGSVITTSSDVNLGTDTAVAAIDDEDKDGDTPPDDKEGDKPTLNLTATDALAIEGVANDVVIFQVAQTNESNSDTVANFKLTLNELEVADITSVKITDGDGTVTTLTTAAEIQALVDTGVSLTIDANSSQTPTVEITPVDDSIYEISEAFGSVITTSSDVNLGTDTAVAAIDDEDKDGDTPPDDKEGDKPTLSVSSITVTEGTDAFAQFTVSLSNKSTQDVGFNLSLSNIQALGLGVDYGNNSASNLQVSTDNGGTWINATSAIIPSGSSSVLVRTPITNDLTTESDETFKLTATVTSGSVTNTTDAFGIGTILDNDTNVVIGTPLDAAVDEDDLSDGNDTGKEPLLITKSLDITAGTDSFDITFNGITDGQDSGLTQNGNTIYYYLDNNSHILTASTSNSEGGISSSNTIFTNTINNPTSANSSYTFELKDSIDHASANGENIKALDFNIVATEDNGYTTTDSFTVSVTDDVPTIFDVEDSVFIGPKTTNLILVLDASGSMQWDFSQNSGSSNVRMNAMKDAAKAMIDGYEELGKVNVMITSFGGANIITYTANGSMTNTQNSWDGTGESIWLDSDTAKNKIGDNSNGIQAGGGTQYKEAMDNTSDAYISSANAGNNPDSDFTYVYFMSDGEPNEGHEPQLSTKWDDLINRAEIDAVDGVAISQAVNVDNLEIVAGTDDSNVLGINSGKGEAYSVTTAAEMQVKLLSETTITITGSVFSDGTLPGIGAGADEAYVTSIVIGNKTYSYDGNLIIDESNNTIGSGSIMTDINTTLTDGTNGIGSKITLDFKTGEYSYTVNSSLSGKEYSESLSTSVIDRDGDSITKDIILKVNTSKTGTGGNDTMLFDDTQALDFLAGNDSLVLDNGINLDFDTKNATINNVEKIDLNSNGNHNITNLGIQDVIDMTDSNNILQILGNSQDSVNLKNGDGGNWVDTGNNDTIDGQDYDIYSKSGDNTAVTLKIDQDITII
ncbi:hypothetical protein LPB137_02285 [Poseidonibacter parvus]|uniref:VWFA domain-containing protein n=1 Tax=Poseidonibacter parvus TaxID=1850254 RepID=A0A1P8KJQ0_9BACT|nr:hypothetical protein [Poseidonibacter parvus]APW64754.1 hypothetical protein LPB137_02285 [Poseidonibacter parvus]